MRSSVAASSATSAPGSWLSSCSLPETEPRRGQADLAGAGGPPPGGAAPGFCIVRSADAGRDDALTLTAVTAGLIMLALFVVNERRSSQPIMPLRLFCA